MIFNIGERRDREFPLNDKEFKTIQMQYWSHLVEDRKKAMENRRKFQEMDNKDYEELKEMYPKFEIGDIIDLRLQYQTFDINQDGVIDFSELMQVLDDLGDRSDVSVREAYFHQIDMDNSGAIDFEEFLTLIYKLRHSDDEFGSLGTLWRQGTDNIRRVRKLSVAKQMLAGLF
ncbi:predicted protein [Nematostella vectensis]|uniref:EF-hand domain-containing protein n=1 Tax=Nematostella vectensis TaxID=45351 RepID=A7RFC1_NEMVE|nr:predicted protein [Nematostella vectensis]|eukprot:XP_001642135.1 predicted protein [Nematostella vectensis]